MILRLTVFLNRLVRAHADRLEAEREAELAEAREKLDRARALVLWTRGLGR